MTVLRDSLMVGELEERLYKGAIRKNRAYRGKIVRAGGRSYIRRQDLLPEHRRAADGLEAIDLAVPLSEFYNEVPGISAQDAFRHIARSLRALIKGQIIRRRHGVFVRVDEEVAEAMERMTPYLVRTPEEVAYASKCATIGNLRIGFY